MEFTHLHWNSTFSFLEAIWTPKEIIEKAKELWFKNIAITDFGGMYWAITLYEAAKKNDINPIIGTELWFVLDIKWYNKIEDIWNICFLGKNIEWYNSLMKIVSHANQEGIAWKPKLDIEMIWKYNKWIIAFMWWKSSWIWKMIKRSEPEEKILEIIEMIQDKLGKENVFLEIIAKDESLDEDIKKINRKILEIAEKSWIKCVVNNIYHYINKSDKEAWEMALAIKDWYKMYDKNRRKPKWDFHIMTREEIEDILLSNWYTEWQIKERIENNNNIANNINIEIPMWQTLFPNYQTPENIKEIYDNVKSNLISE